MKGHVTYDLVVQDNKVKKNVTFKTCKIGGLGIIFQEKYFLKLDAAAVTVQNSDRIMSVEYFPKNVIAKFYQDH